MRAITVMRSMFAAFSRYRPRILTLVVLLVVAALIVLANLSYDELTAVEDGAPQARPYLRKISGGWPLIWHRYIFFVSSGPAGRIGWYYSASRFAGNVAMWFALLAAVGAVCEWLVRRYRPRLRWSLRTMLAAVGLLAAFCSWFAAASRRASLQDPIIAATKASESWVVLERWGPQWLDFLGADPYRRYIVGAKFEVQWSGLADEEVELRLKRVAQAPALRYLSLAVDRLTPAMTDALKEMQQLRVLSIAHRSGHPDDEPISHECVAAIGEISQLEGLRLENMVIASESLKSLENLTDLRSLRFDSCFSGDNGDAKPDDEDDDPSLLGQLPALPQLEELLLTFYVLDDRDVRRLASLPRLKSLRLPLSYLTHEALAELGALKSLEELETHDDLNDRIVSAAGLKSMIAIKHLKALHINRGVDADVGAENMYMFMLDNGDEIAVPAAEANAFRRALDALRKAKPGFIVDNRDHSHEWAAEQKISWYSELSYQAIQRLPQVSPGPSFLRSMSDDELKNLKW